MGYSANYYIRNNDLEGAKARLEASDGRWRPHWYEACEKIFNSCKEWAKFYVLDPINKTVRKILEGKTLFPKLRKTDISASEDCIIENNEKNVQKCYLIEFFDENDESICSKVGTTTRTIQERVREELRSDTYKKMGAVRCIIHRVYDCGKIPAEGLESLFRANYIRKYPNSFHKNDRFIKQKFDLAEADKICKGYLCVAQYLKILLFGVGFLCILPIDFWRPALDRTGPFFVKMATSPNFRANLCVF